MNEMSRGGRDLRNEMSIVKKMVYVEEGYSVSIIVRLKSENSTTLWYHWKITFKG